MKKRRRFLALLMAAAIFAGQTLGSTAGVFAEESGAQSGLTVTEDAPSRQEAEPAAEAEQTKPQLEDDAASQADEQAAEAVQEVAADAQTDPAEDEIVGDEELIPEDELGQEVPTGAADTIAAGPEDGTLVVESVQEVADPMLAAAEPEEEYDGLEVGFGTDSGSFSLLPGKSFELTAYIRYMTGEDEEGNPQYADFSDAVVEWKLYDPEGDRNQGNERTLPELGKDVENIFDGEELCSQITVSAAENASEGSYPIHIAVKENGEEDAATICEYDTGIEQGPSINVASDYWQLQLEWQDEKGQELDQEAVSRLELGDSVTVVPVVTRHYNERDEAGAISVQSEDVTAQASFLWRFNQDEEYGGDALEVTNGQDGPVVAGDEVIGASAKPSFKITKMHNCWADAELIVCRKTEDPDFDSGDLPKGYEWMTSEGLHFDRRDDYDVWLDDEYTVFTDQADATIRVDADRPYGSGGCDSNAVVQWEVIPEGEKEPLKNPGDYGIKLPEQFEERQDEGGSFYAADIQIDGTMLQGEEEGTVLWNCIMIRANLVVEGFEEEPLWSGGTDLRVLPVTVEYNELPEDEHKMLLNESWEIGSVMRAWVCDSETPEGRPEEICVNSVKVSDPNGVLRCETGGDGKVQIDQDEIWRLYARKPGKAEVTVEFVPYGREESVSHIFTIEVTGKLYHMSIANPQGSSDCLFVGRKLVLNTTLYENVADIENRYDQEVAKYTLGTPKCVENDSESGDYRSFVAVNTDGRNIVLTGMNEGWARFEVSAYVEGNEEPVATESFTVNVTREPYYTLDSVSLDEIDLGETISVEDVKPVLYRNDKNGATPVDPEEMSITYRWDFDTDQWQCVNEDGEAATELTRIAGYSVWLELVAVAEDPEDPESEEVLATQHYDFGDIEYPDFAFERDEYNLYADAPLTLTLGGVPENENLRIDCDVFNGENGEDVNYVNLEKEGNTITLSIAGGALGEDDSRNLRVRACLVYGEDEGRQEVGWAETSVYIQDNVCDLTVNEAQLLIGESISFAYDAGEGGYVAWVYMQDASHPDGVQEKVIITDVMEGSYDEELVKVEKTADALVLRAAGVGYPSVYVKVKQAKGSAFVPDQDPPYMQIRFYSLADTYTMKVQAGDADERTGVKLFPDEEAQIRTELTHEAYNKDSGKIEKTTLSPSTDYRILYKVKDEDIAAVDEEGCIKGLQNGWTYVSIFAVRPDYEGDVPKDPDDDETFQEYCLAESRCDIEVTTVYYSLALTGIPLYVEPGKSAVLEAVLMRHSILEANPSKAEGDYTYSCVTNQNVLTAVAKGSTLTLTAGSAVKDTETEVMVFAWDARGRYLADSTVSVTVCRHELKEVENPKASCVADGLKTVTCSKCGYNYTEVVKAKGHDYQGWKTLTPATVTAPEQQQGTCRNCGATIRRSFGSKLTAFARLNVTSLPLKVKQSTKVVKVEMAAGDSIVSWTSSNKKVATVNASGKIKGKKKGKATITVTLASGKTASVKIKVQTPKVTTKKIKGVAKKLTLTKGQKLKLTPELYPLTSVDKIKYTSSNKKVATVDKKGNIKAKKNGTAKITVRAGKKKFICKVTVK